MLKSIANLYDYCFFVDFLNNSPNDLHITSASTPYVENWHYTTIGYIEVGRVIEDIVRKLIKDNLQSFKYVGYYND